MSDRDMYIKQLEEKLIHVVRGTGRTTVCVSVLDFAVIVNLLKEQQEQKHGHWIMPPKFLSESQCSVCKETCVGDCRMFSYCPFCGAMMDEEVKQDG